ncbi:MAG: FHA domain-containing protein, partial [Phycisphaerae bacterium]
MRIIVLQNDSMIEDLVCARQEISIGTDETCQIRLSGSQIAPRQLLIFPDMDGGWVVEKDKHGEAATMNGVKLNGRTVLHSGDCIEIAGYQLRAFPEFHDPNADKSRVVTTREALERFAATQLPTGTVLKKGDDPIVLSRNTLVSCGRINVSISQCTSPTAFMDAVFHALFELFPANRIWIGLRRYNYGAMEYVEGRFREGQPADLTPIGESLQSRALDRNLFMLVPRISSEIRVSVMAGPLLGPVSPLGMIYLDTGETARGFSETDLDRFIG